MIDGGWGEGGWGSGRFGSEALDLPAEKSLYDRQSGYPVGIGLPLAECGDQPWCPGSTKMRAGNQKTGGCILSRRIIMKESGKESQLQGLYQCGGHEEAQALSIYLALNTWSPKAGRSCWLARHPIIRVSRTGGRGCGGNTRAWLRLKPGDRCPQDDGPPSPVSGWQSNGRKLMIQQVSRGPNPSCILPPCN